MRYSTRAVLSALPLVVLAQDPSLVVVPIVINGFTTSVTIPAYTGQTVIEATLTLPAVTPEVIYGGATPVTPQAQPTSPPDSLTIVPVETSPAAITPLPLATNAPDALAQPYGVPNTPAVVAPPGGLDVPESTYTTVINGQTVQGVAPAGVVPTSLTSTNAEGSPVIVIAPLTTSEVAPASQTITTTNGVGSTVILVTAAASSLASEASGQASSIVAAGSATASSIASEASAAASSIAAQGSVAASSLASEASAAASSASAAASSVTAAASSAIASASASASSAASSIASRLSTLTAATSSGSQASPTAPVPTAANAAPDVRIPGAMILMSCVLTVALAWVLS